MADPTPTQVAGIRRLPVEDRIKHLVMPLPRIEAAILEVIKDLDPEADERIIKAFEALAEMIHFMI